MAVFEKSSDVTKAVIWAAFGIMGAAVGAGLYGIDFIRKVTNDAVRAELEYRTEVIEEELKANKSILEREVSQLREELLIAQSLMPTGAVIPFALDNGCPSGWREFDLAAGRFIVGASQSGGGKSLFETGGSEAVAITVEQLPRGVVGEVATTRLRGVTVSERSQFSAVDEVKPFRAGGSEPISTMPPFIALTYCLRE